ncbi:ATP-binding protein [Chryseobacterium flavum]|uniref:histidine kinase n=1 Tax=Chryseobacterium flavum TaxID=415851 RepID=A0A3D9CRU5_9FLAO|nr:ATP-binding protein [Chryseobacterium flavum]REC68419.1 ATP-binding protein [Chryseobacterium flavum]
MKKLIPFLLLLIISSCNKNNTKIDRTEYDKAYGFLKNSQKDSAFKYFNKAKDDFISQENFSYAGSCLVNMAIIQNDYGDYYGSQETGLSAIKYLNEKEDSYELSSNYNSLGITFQNLKEYNKATQYYSLAAKFSQNATDSLTHLNNKAVAFSYSKKFDSAISLFNKILNYPNLKKQPILYSKVYDNQAYFKFLQDKNYNAENELLGALKIRDSINDNWGLIASYSHLTEYFESKNPQKALSYANNMLHFALINKSPDDRLNALKKIIFLENPQNTKTYFKKYQALADSLQTSRNKSKNQFAFERYDSEKLKRENLEKDNNILKLLVGVATLIVVIIFTVVGYRRRQLKLKQEKELEVKNTQLKMSKKVHDVVANGIYQVMTKIENQEDFNRDMALDELEFVYEKSRDISYDKTGEQKEFSKIISELIASFNNNTVKTFTAGNSPAIWESVSPTVKEEIYQLVRELMVNMKKHSQASHVAVKFEKANNIVDIQYKDNGVGISGDLIYNNGLRNAASRIEAINGTITFDTKIEKGLKVNLSFPVS